MEIYWRDLILYSMYCLSVSNDVDRKPVESNENPIMGARHVCEKFREAISMLPSDTAHIKMIRYMLTQSNNAREL